MPFPGKSGDAIPLPPYPFLSAYNGRWRASAVKVGFKRWLS